MGQSVTKRKLESLVLLFSFFGKTLLPDDDPSYLGQLQKVKLQLQ